MAKEARERDIEEDDVVTPETAHIVKEKTPEPIEDDEEDDAPPPKAKAAPAKDDYDGDDDDARLAYDEEDEDDAQGASRRKRRNAAKKRARQMDAETIAEQAARIARLEAQMGQTQRDQVGLYVGEIESNIRDLQSKLQTVDDALADSIEKQDGATHRKAMQLRDDIKNRLQQAAYEHQRAKAAIEQSDPRRQQQAPPQQQQPAPANDPEAKRLSGIFLERHDWFDANDPTDPASAAVKAIDAKIMAEGYRPNTSLYWRELENRIKKSKIIQSSIGDDDVQHDDDEDDVAPAPRRNGGLPPRSSRSSGSRQPGREFALTQDMKESLDQLGLLDNKGLTDDQAKYRKSLVTRWRDGINEARKQGKLR